MTAETGRSCDSDVICAVDGHRFAYIDTPNGQIHCALAGNPDLPALLCLHQTPRSCDEYRELIPLLASHFRVVAMDTPGMGASAPPRGPASIEHYANSAVMVLDALDIERTSVVGHHTGGVIAIDLAARYPERINRLMLSSTPWVDAASRERRSMRPPIDAVDQRPDGTHLSELWARRRACYPPKRPDVLQRFVHDAIAARDPAEGHHAVGRYHMEDTIDRVVAPALCIGASADPYAFGDLEPLAERLSDACVAVVEDATVGLLEDRAAEVAELIVNFAIHDADQLETFSHG